MTNRVSFLVDGFNVYHSAREASRDLGGQGTRWLDLSRLLSSYLPSIGGGAALDHIYYFSALALHRDATKPGVSTRHRLYIEALQDSGVVVELGRFKQRRHKCSFCGGLGSHHEEKETDVAISVRLMELFHRDSCDIAVLVTGDTDLAPVVRTAKALFPAKQVCCAFPYLRRNEELAKLVSRSFRIRKERYAANQFPDPVVLKTGRSLAKPTRW